jgi:group I intron endonuclease
MKGTVYKITNLINQKLYIGSTRQIFATRKAQHLARLRRNAHVNPHLQSAFNKYGEVNILFTIIEECELEDTYRREHYYIQLLNTIDHNVGYNIVKNTENYVPTPKRPHGIKRVMPVEQRLKISAAQKGKKLNPEHIEKMRYSRIGMPNLAKRKPVVQYTLDDIFIKEWSGAIEAANYLNPTNSISAMKLISQACVRSQYPTALGFKWKHKLISTAIPCNSSACSYVLELS